MKWPDMLAAWTFSLPRPRMRARSRPNMAKAPQRASDWKKGRAIARKRDRNARRVGAIRTPPQAVRFSVCFVAREQGARPPGRGEPGRSRGPVEVEVIPGIRIP